MIKDTEAERSHATRTQPAVEETIVSQGEYMD